MDTLNKDFSISILQQLQILYIFLFCVIKFRDCVCDFFFFRKLDFFKQNI